VDPRKVCKDILRIVWMAGHRCGELGEEYEGHVGYGCCCKGVRATIRITFSSVFDIL